MLGERNQHSALRLAPDRRGLPDVKEASSDLKQGAYLPNSVTNHPI